MTVTSNTTRNDYVAGTNQNVYNYTFQLNEASDVTVYLGGVVQTLNTHYTVQNVGVGTGGTITFTLVDGNNNPIYPTSGTAISIVMAMDLDRDTDYQANGAFLAAEVNNDYDRLWLASNQQQTAINRSLRLQDDDVAGASPSMELPLKDDRKGKLLGFHATTGEPITAVTINAADYVEKAGDTMTGTLNMGANKVTSSATPSATSDLTNKQYVDAAVAGVPQGSITGVTAGTGMTGGGTTGDVTLNVIGGTGITANADDISVDNTVVLTTGVQTLSNKSFSSIKLIENGDTKVQWPFGLNDDFFFADNQKVLFGIDMQLYHDGSNSYIKDVGTGNLYIDTNSSTHLSQGGNDKIVITSNQVTVDPRLQFNTLRGAGAIEVDIIRDEDDMVSDDPDALATQQSIKAYVDSQVSGDITAVTAGAGLTGGGTSGNVTLNAVGGTGITVNADDIQVTDNGIGALQLNVSGNGTSGQFLASDGDGTFSWQTGGSGGNETLAQTLVLGNTTGGTDLSVSSGDNIVMAASSTVDGRDLSVDGAKLDLINQGVATTDSPAFVNLTLSGTGSVKVPSGTTAQRDGSPANGMFRYNSTTEEFEGYSDGEWGSIGGGGGSSNLNIDTMTGDGSDTTLTLSINPTVENNTQVYIDGVYQNKDTYSVSGTTLTFSTAPPTGSAVEVMTITPTALLVPADGSVTPAKIASGDFYFDTNTLYVDSTNNRVGIGTASPSAKLDVGGQGCFQKNYSYASTNYHIKLKSTYGNGISSYIGNVSSADRMNISSGGYYYGASLYQLTDGATGMGAIGIGEDGTLTYQSTTGETANSTVNPAERMRIDSSGQVGIGTSSPEATLHIADIGSTGPALHIAGGSATEGDITTPHNETLQIGHWNESSNAFTERMRIDTSGSVGLRTTANVVSSTSGEGAWLSSGGYLAIAREGTTTSHPVLYLNQTGVTGQLVQFRKDGTSVGSISTNGSSLPSDRNFKRNIESLDLGLDFVASLNPVTYNYKLDEEGQPVMTGLIAQEVEESLTAAGVEKNSMTLLQHTPTDDVKESDYQMDYLKLVPILINSIKEQQTLIESLTDRIAALEE